MSIFKDTFRKYVRDQISLREEIVNLGSDDLDSNFSNRYSSNEPGKFARNAVKNLKLQSGTEIKDLEAGAFYNLVNRQCIIRATSMVDYVENVDLEIGGLVGENSFNALKGAALSQNFILEGGTLSDFARVRNGQRVTRRVETPRDSFPRPGQRTSLGYGDLAIGADAGDGYGIVPMPGIVDLNVRTKSAYGSLREAKLNFECHNRRQLEVLEMLYMRPGYMVALEWGWTPYINNNGRKYTGIRLLEDYFTDTGDSSGKNSRIYTNNITQQEIFNGINKLKEFHCGNYDGFLGFVKNFGFQAREDGGFTCFTELTSIGEVVESLRIPNVSLTNPVIDVSSEDDQSVEDSSNVVIVSDKQFGGSQADVTAQIDKKSFNTALEKGIFPRYNGLLGMTKALVNYSVFNNGSRGTGTGTRNTEFEDQQLDKIFENYNTETIDALEDGDQKDALNESRDAAIKAAEESNYNDYAFNEYLRDLVRYQSTTLERYLRKTLQIPEGDSLNNYIIPIGGKQAYVTGDAEANKNRLRNTQSYIRWDALCVLINENLITKDEKALTPVTLVSDRIYDEGEGFAKVDPLLYVPISDYKKAPTNSLLDFSCDSNVCILPVQLATNTLADVGGKIDTYYVEDSLGYIPDISVFPSSYIAGTYNRQLPLKYDGYPLTPPPITGPTDPRPIPLTKTDQLRRIGSIFLNINMLNDLAEKNADKEDYTLGQFLKDIWDEVNKVCPNHNFVITDDKESNTIFVIDLPVDNSAVPLDLHTFIPFSNKNILRSFEYTSNVPKAMSATIAIQSQDPRSIQDIDGVTFAAFNRSIKNRLLSEDITSNHDKVTDAINDNKESVLVKQNQLYTQMSRYQGRFFTNLKLIANESEPVTEGNIKGILKEYQKNAAYLSTAVTATSTFNSVIPLEFSATLDGISGIVIGNMFKVDKSRLPKAYGKANIGFIVFNEDQKITDQDWTTDISGKMTILPTEANKPVISGVASTVNSNTDFTNTPSSVRDGSETNELSEGQDTVVPLPGELQAVYLKKTKDNSILGVDIKGVDNIFTLDVDEGTAYFGRRDGDPNDLPVTTYGKTIGKSHGYTSVRWDARVSNRSGTDNFIGMFNSWDDGGALLGTVKAGGIKTVLFEDGKVALKVPKIPEYFDLDSQSHLVDTTKTITFTPDTIDGKTVHNIDGVEYYIVTSPIVKLAAQIDAISKQPVPYDNKQAKRHIKVSDTTNVDTVWYNILFSETANEIFHNGWSREGNWIDPTGANRQLRDHGSNKPPLSEYSKNNDVWMRFDTIAADPISAVQAFQPIEENDEFPEPNENENPSE